ncbi:MAG: HAD hydrolase-like protein [Clostridiales bacterium]|nr:HAD hydrolase-like protein [Clostridiales bacterium]
MYKTALFDLDGTLIDSKESITKSFQHALASLDVNVMDADGLTKFIGPPIREFFQEQFHLSPFETELAVKKTREYFAEHGMSGIQLYDGIPELLCRLQNEGVRMAVATSKPTDYAEKIIEHFALERYFDLIAGSEMDGMRSGKGEIIRFALDVLKTSLPAVMIGDRRYDMIGAREVCIDSIGVTWGYGSHSEFERSGAVAIAKTPEDLYRLIVEKNI